MLFAANSFKLRLRETTKKKMNAVKVIEKYFQHKQPNSTEKKLKG